MTVLVSRPPAFRASFVNEDLGLALVTSALRGAGYECRFEDALQTQTPAADYLERLIEAPERIVCVTVHAECWADEIFSLLSQVKARAPEKIIIVGGHPMSAIDEDAFRVYPASFDYIIRGDGELLAVDLVRALSNGRDLPEHPDGISYARAGQLQRFPDARRNHNYDSLPRAARDVWSNGLRKPRSGSALLSFARGCNHVCSFCSVVEFYGRSQRFWRSRRIDGFIDEVEELRSRHGIADFTIVDPNFLGQPENDNRQVRELVAELGRLDEGLVFDIACRSDSVEPKLFEEMRRAGVRRVFVGLESGDATTLSLWRKQAVPSRGLQAVHFLNELGIYVHTGFIMLSPTTSLRDIESNLRFLAELPYFDLQSLAAPLLPLHSVQTTSSIPAQYLVKSRTQIQYRYVFRDRRVAVYHRMVGQLCARLSPAFMKLRGAMWTNIAEHDAVRRYADTTRRLQEPCLAFAHRVVEALERGEEASALQVELDAWLAAHETLMWDAATAFGGG